MNFRAPRRKAALALAGALFLTFAVAHRLSAQAIEYESKGSKYQTLSRQGLTVIITHLPNHVAGFGLIQVSIANGSGFYWTVRPEDFSYQRAGLITTGISAEHVVDILLDKGSHADVVKLVTSYENSLYGIPNMRASNGYELRRQGAFSIGMSAKLKAAATASAIALAEIRLPAGESTDGAVFLPLSHDMKDLAGGRIIFRNNGAVFEFNPD